MLKLVIILLCLTVASPAAADPVTLSVALGVSVATATAVINVAISLAISIALGLISQLLTPKPKGRKPLEKGITQLIRASAEPHKIVWGERPISGVLIFAEVSGSDSKFLHMVISLTGHQVESLGTVFFNDVGIDDNQLDGSGNVTSGRFANRARIKKHLGEDNQTADANLVAEVGAWTTDHRLQGVSYLYVRLEFDREVYPTGIPNVKVMVKGRLIGDPRDTAIVITSSSIADQTVIATDSVHGLTAGNRTFISGHTGAVPEIIGEYQVLSVPTTTTFTIDVAVITGGTGGSLLQMKWSDNGALCLRDYLLAGFGLNVDQADEIDDTKSIAAANICDEEVNLSTSLNTFNFTADPANDTLTQTAVTKTKPEPLHPIDGVELTTSGTLPAGLSLATRYFVISASGKEEPFTFKLATSIVNARAEVVIDITDSGSGVHTLTRKTQPRYTINGVESLENDPINIAPALIFAMGGQLTYTQGKYAMFAGAFNGPATIATLTESSLRGEITVRPRPGKATIHNSVSGTFIDRDNKFLETDFPPIVNSTFVTADKEEKIFKDISLVHVTDSHRAQRLARLINQRDRQGLVADYPANLTVLEVAVGDVVDVTNDLLGWTDKEFEVLAWQLAEDGGIDLVLKETAAAVYTFDPETDEQVLDIAPNTNLTSPFDAPPIPVGMVLASGTDQLLIVGDGTVISRIRVTWTGVQDVGVSSGGRVEIQMKKSADTLWGDMPSALGEAVQAFLSPVEDGIAYDVRIRNINRLGVVSDYVTVSSHTVLGKTAPPSDVTSFTIDGTTLNWTHSFADVDLDGFVIRYHQGLNQSFGNAIALHDGVLSGSLYDLNIVPAGQVTLLIKAVDTSGNFSVTPATIITNFGDAVVANVVETIDFKALDWPGNLTDGTINGSNNLLADDTGDLMWDADSSRDMWTLDSVLFYQGAFKKMTYEDSFIPSLAAEGSILTISFTAVGDSILVEYRLNGPDLMWSTTTGELMWDVVTTTLMWAVPDYQAWPGSATAINDVYDIRVTTGFGIPQSEVSALAATIDVPDIVERLDDVVLASGGTRLSLTETFTTVISNVNVTLQDDGGSAITVRVMDKSLSLGPLIQAFDTSDVGTAGTIDATVQGY